MAIGGQGRMREEKIYLTPEGKAEMEAKLHYLRTVKRPQVADYIHEAKEAGDVSESSAYEEAKNDQARLEGEIRELEYRLAHAEILDPNEVHAGGGPRTVRIGSTIEFTMSMPSEVMGWDSDVAIHCFGRVVRHQCSNERLMAAAVIDDYYLKA